MLRIGANFFSYQCLHKFYLLHPVYNELCMLPVKVCYTVNLVFHVNSKRYPIETFITHAASETTWVI